jgi:hypothetical protein
VEGIDGLGNPVGWWRGVRRLARRGARFVPGAASITAGLRVARPFLRRAIPAATRLAPYLPGGASVSAGLRVASPYLRQAGVAGHGGLGALYEAPDGTLYQMQGLAEDEELRGYGEDEDLRGLAEDDELRGLAEDEELRGYGEDDELRGFAEDDELRGLGEDDELRGLNGYVRQDGMAGVDAFVPQEPARTRWFTSPSQQPEMWKPLW